MTNPPPPGRGARSLVGPGIAILARYWLLIGIWMAASPHTFFTAIGPVGRANAHYVRDNATFEIALGVALLIALRRASWRVPLLAVVLVQDVLHVINHLVDVWTAHPRWVGVFDAAALAAFGAFAAWLLLSARREEPVR